LLASSLSGSTDNPQIRGDLVLPKTSDASIQPPLSINPDVSDLDPGTSSEEYSQLQLRIFRLTLVVTGLAALLTTIFVDFHAAISLLIGSFAGLLYLRILARSIGNLGKKSTAVNKIQLIVPVILFLAAVKLPQLDLFPALVGFLLYKPSLIFQFLLYP